MNSSRYVKKAYQSISVDTIFTNLELSIFVLCCAIMQSMTHINASNSECNGERLMRKFLAPIIGPSTSFLKQNQHIPEKMYVSFPRTINITLIPTEIGEQ